MNSLPDGNVPVAEETKVNDIYSVDQNVMHPLHGIGVVEKIEEKNVLGKDSQFAVISFQGGRLKIMINLHQKSNLIRNLISGEEIPRVLDFLKTCRSDLPIKSSERYNINLKKIKSSDIYQLAEVIKDLAELSKNKKLSPKELSMLKQSKKMLGLEIGHITNTPAEQVEIQIEATCRGEA